jgi:uncharacterized protein
MVVSKFFTMKTFYLSIVLFVSIALNAQKVKPTPLPESEKVIEAKEYLTGSNGQRNPAKGIELLEQSVNKGSTEAMIELGLVYMYGIYAKKDMVKAVDLFTKAAKKDNAHGWHLLGLIYKDATDKTQNFKKAYQYFENGTNLSHKESMYAQAYMLFKGFGVKQDYTKALNLFSRSSESAGSQYFLGLCYRNGYGTAANEQLATAWLNKAAANGYSVAKTELQSAPENSNKNAVALAEILKNSFVIKSDNVNIYQRLDNIPTATIEGKYTGHLIRYDWSRKHAINNADLQLDIIYKNGQLTGIWTEADSLKVPLKAIVTPNSIVFREMEYEKKDHYNMIKPLLYRFENASLNWTKKDGETALQGNIQMFSVMRNEPEKPIAIFLTKSTANSEDSTAINLVNEDGSSILLSNSVTAYPNPFKDVITLNFKLLHKAHVVTKLFSMEGNLLYKNDAGFLAPGYYALPVKPAQNLASGTYLLVLDYGSFSKKIKIVKP